MNPELDRKLRYLRLSAMAVALEGRNQEAIHHHLAYPEFLELLVEDELATRRDRLFARRLKQAGITEVKTLEGYDWSFNPKVPRSLIADLATARFVREHGRGPAHRAAGHRQEPHRHRPYRGRHPGRSHRPLSLRLRPCPRHG